MAEWVNHGRFAPGLGASTDPLIGAGDDRHTRRFETPVDGEARLRVDGFASFVRTLGGAYCFLPSLTALRWLAGAGGGQPRSG